MSKVEARFETHDEFLEIIVSGTYDLQEAMGWAPSALSACRQLGLTKVFVDYRALTGDAAATQKILYSVGVLDQYTAYVASGGQPLKIAYLGASPLVDSYQPGAEVANASGMDVGVFTDAAEAREWLGV